MTRPKLADIEQRADAATEGPWEADGSEVSQHWSLPEPWLTVASNEVSCMSYCYGGSARGIEQDEDAEFIAHARTDVPAMSAAIRDVLAVHVEATCSRGYPQAYCVDCDQAWPCATVRAVTAHIDVTPKEN
ncbi:hypothetical protein [Sanguibacter sp. HDW7]|uniref:hypothetical protein n=1 Tax=Sanguibacter sp. HDW7 TaxID=2714931 RepID=UPI001408B108|nr:hypothetical protein [Sanguibacter sp. HDW7]QIK82416.1 hypothetical protein G7063_01395 [Sanguibacter sp. HDW7]